MERDAEYGRAQGGVVNLTTREPRTDHWRVGGSMGVLDSSVVFIGKPFTAQHLAQRVRETLDGVTGS